LVSPQCGLGAAQLDHGDAFAIDRGYQDRAGGGLGGALAVKGVKVLSRIRQDLLQAALGYGDTGQLGNGLNRFQEGVLHRGLNQAPLEFVGERAGGQGQCPVQWKDAGRAGAGVAHTDEFHGSKDGSKRASAKPTMGVEAVAVLLLEAQGAPDIPVASLLQVGLKQQTLDLTSFGLLLGLDLVKGELESAGGCQPGLKQGEFESGRR